MTTSTRIPSTEVSGAYGAIVKLAARELMGRVPDSIGVLWQHPAVMKDAMGIGRRVEAWRELDRELATYAAMAAAASVGCGFCLDLNYFMAHTRGLDEAKVREVPRWREASVFTPLERTVMEYAEAASQTPPAVTDELSDALLAELGPAALVELAARVSFMNMSARMNVALGITSELFADACGLPPLAAAQSVADGA
ncbi:carboxymuconolactone decarboxylase family protein [Microbacterium ulmi]|uniref:Carboxymuconolactone decarboxylase family protein n=1 Tax=Microbacterium ulmi TaxID=179095 RepID=A0A7Y2Q2E5_9MICO|nr:carboxymuconolactone decarboxylase family protein [Microbacterium ulmi]NII68160.1 AhpD family alkylhydroperoxidase [Microbacterium ulmi]NNH05352.1 carboxymuconolactone decarboxylase family protein [Microbacterium ulmi]